MSIATNNYQFALRTHQRGAVLVISLIILLVITMLAVGSMQNTLLEEKMAGNSSDRNLAFQSTESAVREAEVFVEGMIRGGAEPGIPVDALGYLLAALPVI